MRGIAKQLTAGDTVEVRAVDTTRTLTVTQEARYVKQEPYRCNGLLVTVEGYGTTYDIEIPDSDDYSCPKLLFSSTPATGYQVLDLDLAGDDEFGLVAEQTASDLGIPDR